MRNHLAVEVIDRIALDAFKVNVVLSANVCVCRKGNWGLLSLVEQSGNGICTSTSIVKLVYIFWSLET